MKQSSKRSLPQPGRPRPMAVRLCAVRDYLSGMTQKEVCEKYDLPDCSVISLWKRKYATNISAMKKKEHKKKRPAVTQLEASLESEVSRLRRELQQERAARLMAEASLKKAELRATYSEMMVEMAESEYGIDIRKNSAAK